MAVVAMKIAVLAIKTVGLTTKKAVLTIINAVVAGKFQFWPQKRQFGQCIFVHSTCILTNAA